MERDGGGGVKISLSITIGSSNTCGTRESQESKSPFQSCGRIGSPDVNMVMAVFS